MEHGNDPSVDAAAAKLLGRFTGMTDDPPKRNQDTREPARAAQPEQAEIDPDSEDALNGYYPDEGLAEGADAKAADDAEGDKAQTSQEDFFELPGEDEGAEAERIPRADVIAAVRQMRQLTGGIEEAVTKVEMEAQAKADEAFGEIVQMHTTVRERAEAALRMIPQPMQPPRSMLNPQSPDYDPEYYGQLLNAFESQMRVIGQIKTERDEAVANERRAIETFAMQHNMREHERMARFIPEWKDEKTREAKAAEISQELEKHFGIPAELMAKVPFDHRLIRMALAAIEAKRAPVKAVEVRKAIQDKAPKIDNRGRIPSQDRAPNGQFVSDAKKRLRSEGSESAAAEKWLRDGTIRL